MSKKDKTNIDYVQLFVSGKRKDARPKHFKLGKTVNSYGTKLSKKYNKISLQNCFKKLSINVYATKIRTRDKRTRKLNSKCFRACARYSCVTPFRNCLLNNNYLQFVLCLQESSELICSSLHILYFRSDLC